MSSGYWTPAHHFAKSSAATLLKSCAPKRAKGRSHNPEGATLQRSPASNTWSSTGHGRSTRPASRTHAFIGSTSTASDTFSTPTYGVKAGERINWSVSLTPVRELLDLPLRFREQFNITEDDIDASAYGNAIAAAKCADVLLGQVIHSVLYELSFHGGPEQQAEFHDELVARKAEVDAGPAKLIPADDVFDELHRPGLETLYETLGGVPRGEVSSALRRIADDEPVGARLEREFDGKVVVKAQYRDRLGREFRKAFRAAGR